MLYAFEDYVLDTGRRELHRGPNLVPVEPKVLDLLAHLIANRDRVVSKDELMAAVWDGRIVSESALTTCINAARTAVGDSGEMQRLIRTLPRKGVRFVGEVREEAQAAVTPHQPPSPPDKPSIAVLPFTNLSGDPEQDYFADGVVEDIIAALSRFRGLFVIARNSTFTYKGRSVDIKQVGKELGVRYVLEGSVRRSADRIRIVSQLIDASTGTGLAANRFEGTLGDVFDLQDRVTESVVGQLAPKLEKAEIERAQRKTENLDAYDHYLRGMAIYNQWTKTSTEEALAQWRRATDLDQGFAMAYARSGMAYFRRKAFGRAIDPAFESAETARLARLAVRFGKDDASALGFDGFSLAYVAGELDEGAGYVERAFALNPNLASTQHAAGWIKNWLGEPEQATGHFAHAMRLSPLDPLLALLLNGMAHAHFFAGRYDEASSWAEMALKDQPDNHASLRIVAASHALAGRMEKARALAERLRRVALSLRVSNVQATLGPYRRPEDLAKYQDALRQAGLPD